MHKRLLFLVFILLSGCTFNYFKPAYTTLEFEASEGINPDLNGRASPLVVKVYELTSRTLFDSRDFFSLYESPKKALGSDLVVIQEYSFYPGSSETFEASMVSASRYIGIVAAYRDIENAHWREVIEIDPKGYDTLAVKIDELRISVKK
ncbi:type VI secretion system lipoprotein TssJ [Thaumasiovibrio sp. DFM-14]|uniref:type VI secretion system lipoprotein TssJ n=1 Tax=Thaumasiovibrio sp. DFM-14 TaxID=3384792 RepID=UPI0039A3BA78